MNILQSIAAVLTPLGLLWTAIILGVATFLHELAHYALARRQGVEVKSFSVGMGPVLFKKQWQGTEWRLSLLPLGGYVEIDGMAAQEDEGGQEDGMRLWQAPTKGFAALPALGKLAVLFAGPLTNLLLAISLMTLLFSVHGLPVPDRARIEQVVSGYTAEKLGLRAGDVIVALDGQDIPEQVSSGQKTSPGWESVRTWLNKEGRRTLTIERAGQPQNLSFDWQPIKNGERQLLGIRFGPDLKPAPLGTALMMSLESTAQAVPQVLKAFGQLLGQFFRFDLSKDEQVTGPIGTAQAISQAAALSPWALVQIAIVLNLSLALFNLLPIPGLDGGRMLLVMISAVRGRPLSFQQEQLINLAGFAFVMLLMVFVLIRDVSRFL